MDNPVSHSTLDWQVRQRLFSNAAQKGFDRWSAFLYDGDRDKTPSMT